MSLVRTLICEYMADVTARDSQNNTPLNVAALTGNEEIVLAFNKIVWSCTVLYCTWHVKEAMQI